MNLWGLLVIALGLAILAVGAVGSQTKIWGAITGAAGASGPLVPGGPSTHAPGKGPFA